MRRPLVAGVPVMVAAGLALAGCGSSHNGSASGPPCFGKSQPSRQASAAGPAAAAGHSTNLSGVTLANGARLVRAAALTRGSGAPGGAAAARWALPGASLQNTRDVASAINSSNVAKLGVAWTVPLPGNGAYATTPVVVHGVVYTQDLASNVWAIRLATGKVLWKHSYNAANGGPDGVNVVNGTVYAATSHAAVALSAATGKQRWSRTLTTNSHEGIDMAPGYNNGTVYVSTVPVNPTVGEYLGDAAGTLYALSASTGAKEWSWDEVQGLWGKPGINSGGGLWEPPSFDAQGNLYLGIANPGPVSGAPRYPWGTSRPGPDLYTDSIVKLSPRGKLLWYYQLTPHDLFDWDLQDSPVLTTAGGQPVVIDAGKAGIMVEVNALTGKLLWKLPVGVHNGHENDGLLTQNANPAAHLPLPATFCLEPGGFGGVVSPLASNGSTAFAAVNNLPMRIASTNGYAETERQLVAAIARGTGEMVAVNQDTGKVEWARQLPSSPYGAASVTSNVVFTTTYHGDLYAFNTATGATLLDRPLSAGTNAPVAIDGDYVITAASAAALPGQKAMIIAFKLGATGKLPHTVGR